MPPRLLNIRSCWTSSPLPFRPAKAPTASPLPLISAANASSKAKSRHRDPYALAQARQRKLANLKRQEELKKERESDLGDPVRGITTPFIESFDTAVDPDIDSTTVTHHLHLNHFLKPGELEKSLQHSFILSQPYIAPQTERDIIDPEAETKKIKRHAEGHEIATKALEIIVNLGIGNAKDRLRANTQRCIATFGRHNTDRTLAPRLASSVPRGPDAAPEPVKMPRAGPDTGSSEVQIAILTAKIRSLSNHLEKKGCQNDKVNQRNMRLLVHRRQKLLAYLRKKDHGGPRWQHLIETLGLTEGTWKGEITL